MVRGSSRLGKIGGHSGWWNTSNCYGLQIMFYLVYHYVLTHHMVIPLLPTIMTTIKLIKEGTDNYNQSMVGSLIVELSGWISWLQFSSFTFDISDGIKSLCHSTEL